MYSTGAAASCCLRGRCAATGKPVVVRWPPLLRPQLAPVIGATFFIETLTLQSYIKDLVAACALFHLDTIADEERGAVWIFEAGTLHWKFSLLQKKRRNELLRRRTENARR